MLPRLLLGLVVAIGLLLLAAAWIGEAPGGHGVAHPDHATMLQGGPGGPRSAPILALGWGFGALQLAFFAVCFALGVRRREGLGPLARPIALAWIAYELLWAALVVVYWRSVDDPGVALWLGFPPATALMLFGLWPFPLAFMAIYLRHFDDWVLTERDLRRFRERLAARARDER